MSAKG